MHTHQDPYQVVGFEKMELNNAKTYTNFRLQILFNFLEFLNNTKNKQCSIEDVYSMVISSSGHINYDLEILIRVKKNQFLIF
jgi:hypothetical protein